MRIALALLLIATVLGGLGLFVSALKWVVMAALALFVVGAIATADHANPSR